MPLIRNEQTKLTATFLNGLAVALFAVGGLAPLFSAIYGTSGGGWRVIVGAVSCFAAALALHLAARTVLRRLEG